jgi:hypothetical protein
MRMRRRVKRRRGLTTRSGRVSRPYIELKTYNEETYSGTSFVVGQVAGNDSGHFIENVTPLIPRGAGDSDRIGVRLKFKSVTMNLQIFNQVNCTLRNKFVISFCRCEHSNPTNTTVMADLWEPNNFLLAGGSETVYDTHLIRNPNFIGKIKIIKSKTIYVDGKDYTDQLPRTNRLKFTVPLNLVQKYSDTDSFVNNRFYVIIRASNGNSGSSASTLNVPDQTAGSGAQFNYALQWKYTDA